MRRPVQSWPFAAAIASVALLAACSLPNVGLWDANGKADTGLYGEYGSRIVHGLVPYHDFSMEFPPGAIPPLAVPALPGSHYVVWFKLFELVCALAAVTAVAWALLDARPRKRLAAVLALVARRESREEARRALLAGVGVLVAVWLPFAALGPGGLKFSLQEQV